MHTTTFRTMVSLQYKFVFYWRVFVLIDNSESVYFTVCRERKNVWLKTGENKCWLNLSHLCFFISCVRLNARWLNCIAGMHAENGKLLHQSDIFFGLLLVWLEVYSEAFGAQQCNPQQVRVYRGHTSLPLTLHLHTDWLRVRWPLFPNRGRAIRTCTSFRVTCLLWECRPMIGCAGACGCGLPCGCSEGGRKRRSRRRKGQQSEWLVKCESVCRINFREMRVIPE